MHSEPMIAVRDVRASAAWYCELLGCESDHGREDFDRLVDPESGEVLLMLHQTAALEHGLAAPGHGVEGNGFLLWIHVDDLDAVLARVRKLRVPIVVAPHANPQAGWREMTVRDPDGYHVALVEP
jgi:catechol 2,3-dioxygenase-like lactoylglutathione lyase family enzyme